jgi:AcrR family transcriptional regulator
LNRSFEFDLREGSMAPNTRHKILDAAEKLFARQGFESTSLRSIIASANVNLAAIHYHFRSKEGLIRAVIERRFAPVNDERLRLLAEFENQTDGKAPRVEKILEAFLAPMLRIGLLESGQGQLLMQLGGRLLQASDGMLEKAAGGEFERVAVRFLAALQKALPSLTRQEIAWRMNFTIGAAARALFGGIPVKVLSSASHENLQERDVQRVLQRLITYTTAGMRAQAGNHRLPEVRP